MKAVSDFWDIFLSYSLLKAPLLKPLSRDRRQRILVVHELKGARVKFKLSACLYSISAGAEPSREDNEYTLNKCNGSFTTNFLSYIFKDLHNLFGRFFILARKKKHVDTSPYQFFEGLVVTDRFNH